MVDGPGARRLAVTPGRRMPALALKPPARCAMIHAMADDHPAPIADDAMKGVRYAVCQTLLPELRHPGGRQALLAAQLVG
jgi:hypothetical protein